MPNWLAGQFAFRQASLRTFGRGYTGNFKGQKGPYVLLRVPVLGAGLKGTTANVETLPIIKAPKKAGESSFAT